MLIIAGDGKVDSIEDLKKKIEEEKAKGNSEELDKLLDFLKTAGIFKEDDEEEPETTDTNKDEEEEDDEIRPGDIFLDNNHGIRNVVLDTNGGGKRIHHCIHLADENGCQFYETVQAVLSQRYTKISWR